MKHYELNCLLSPKLNIDQIKEFAQNLSLFFEEGGQNESLTKIRLSYPIKKEGESFLYTVRFKTSPLKIKNLEEKLNSEKKDKILRFKIITPRIKKLSSMPRRPTKIISIEKKSPLISKRKKTQKVEIEKIDKKLKEILGE